MLNRSLFTALLALLAFALSSAHAMAASSGAVVFSRVTEDSRTYEKADGEKFVKEPEGGLFAARNGRLNTLTDNPADGSGQHAVSGGAEIDSRPVFSADGRLVVFQRAAAAGAVRDLYAVGVGGGNLRPLVQSPEDDHSVTFSSDGKTIVFVRSTAGASDDLYSVRPSGGAPRRLTKTGRIDEFAPRCAATAASSASWSPAPAPPT